MTKCAVCTDADGKQDAIMYCANCGKGICEKHVKHGRYCSEQCYLEHEQDKTERGEEHEETKLKRKSQTIIIGVVLAAVILIALYLIAQAVGVIA